jgi:ATP-dependent Clp protease ATP-binding subunit ClpB
VDFKNTVVIMTSNIGSEYLLSGINAQGEIDKAVRDRVMGDLARHFRPEFLNRVDDIVLFKPLKQDDIVRIIDLTVAAIQKRLNDRNIKLGVTDAAKRLIAEKSYTPVYGARPVKRYLQKVVETQVGRMMVSGELIDGGLVKVDAEGGELKIIAE